VLIVTVLAYVCAHCVYTASAIVCVCVSAHV
jgi:hypothetical protein